MDDLNSNPPVPPQPTDAAADQKRVPLAGSIQSSMSPRLTARPYANALTNQPPTLDPPPTPSPGPGLKNETVLQSSSKPAAIEPTPVASAPPPQPVQMPASQQSQTPAPLTPTPPVTEPDPSLQSLVNTLADAAEQDLPVTPLTPASEPTVASIPEEPPLPTGPVMSYTPPPQAAASTPPPAKVTPPAARVTIPASEMPTSPTPLPPVPPTTPVSDQITRATPLNIDPNYLVNKSKESQQLMQAAQELHSRLTEKEQQLNSMQLSTMPQKSELQSLHTEAKTINAVIQNLKSQFSNMMDNKEAINTQNNVTINDIQSKIQNKEEQSRQLDGKITSLKQSISQEQQLTKEVENYRQQIRELVTQQQKLQDVISDEENRLNLITQQLSRQAAETESLASQKKKLEEFLNEAILNTAHTPTKEQHDVTQAQFINPNEIPTLTQKPNAINGVVKDQNGKLVPDVVIMIKDAASHNLRALKSNKLGQFVVTTPLVDGQYFIESTKPGFTFQVVEVKLDGSVMPPIEVLGHETAT